MALTQVPILSKERRTTLGSSSLPNEDSKVSSSQKRVSEGEKRERNRIPSSHRHLHINCTQPAPPSMPHPQDAPTNILRHRVASLEQHETNTITVDVEEKKKRMKGTFSMMGCDGTGSPVSRSPPAVLPFLGLPSSSITMATLRHPRCEHPVTLSSSGLSVFPPSLPILPRVYHLIFLYTQAGRLLCVRWPSLEVVWEIPFLLPSGWSGVTQAAVSPAASEKETERNPYSVDEGPLSHPEETGEKRIRKTEKEESCARRGPQAMASLEVLRVAATIPPPLSAAYSSSKWWEVTSPLWSSASRIPFPFSTSASFPDTAHHITSTEEVGGKARRRETHPRHGGYPLEEEKKEKDVYAKKEASTKMVEEHVDEGGRGGAGKVATWGGYAWYRGTCRSEKNTIGQEEASKTTPTATTGTYLHPSLREVEEVTEKRRGDTVYPHREAAALRRSSTRETGRSSRTASAIPKKRKGEKKKHPTTTTNKKGKKHKMDDISTKRAGRLASQRSGTTVQQQKREETPRGVMEKDQQRSSRFSASPFAFLPLEEDKEGRGGRPSREEEEEEGTCIHGCDASIFSTKYVGGAPTCGKTRASWWNSTTLPPIREKREAHVEVEVGSGAFYWWDRDGLRQGNGVWRQERKEGSPTVLPSHSCTTNEERYRNSMEMPSQPSPRPSVPVEISHVDDQNDATLWTTTTRTSVRSSPSLERHAINSSQREASVLQDADNRGARRVGALAPITFPTSFRTRIANTSTEEEWEKTLWKSLRLQLVFQIEEIQRVASPLLSTNTLERTRKALHFSPSPSSLWSWRPVFHVQSCAMERVTPQWNPHLVQVLQHTWKRGVGDHTYHCPKRAVDPSPGGSGKREDEGKRTATRRRSAPPFASSSLASFSGPSRNGRTSTSHSAKRATSATRHSSDVGGLRASLASPLIASCSFSEWVKRSPQTSPSSPFAGSWKEAVALRPVSYRSLLGSTTEDHEEPSPLPATPALSSSTTNQEEAVDPVQEKAASFFSFPLLQCTPHGLWVPAMSAAASSPYGSFFSSYTSSFSSDMLASSPSPRPGRGTEKRTSHNDHPKKTSGSRPLHASSSVLGAPLPLASSTSVPPPLDLEGVSTEHSVATPRAVRWFWPLPPPLRSPPVLPVPSSSLSTTSCSVRSSKSESTASSPAPKKRKSFMDSLLHRNPKPKKTKKEEKKKVKKTCRKDTPKLVLADTSTSSQPLPSITDTIVQAFSLCVVVVGMEQQGEITSHTQEKGSATSHDQVISSLSSSTPQIEWELQPMSVAVPSGARMPSLGTPIGLPSRAAFPAPEPSHGWEGEEQTGTASRAAGAERGRERIASPLMGPAAPNNKTPSPASQEEEKGTATVEGLAIKKDPQHDSERVGKKSIAQDDQDPFFSVYHASGSHSHATGFPFPFRTPLVRCLLQGAEHHIPLTHQEGPRRWWWCDTSWSDTTTTDEEDGQGITFSSPCKRKSVSGMEHEEMGMGSPVPLILETCNKAVGTGLTPLTRASLLYPETCFSSPFLVSRKLPSTESSALLVKKDGETKTYKRTLEKEERNPKRHLVLRTGSGKKKKKGTTKEKHPHSRSEKSRTPPTPTTRNAMASQFSTPQQGDHLSVPFTRTPRKLHEGKRRSSANTHPRATTRSTASSDRRKSSSSVFHRTSHTSSPSRTATNMASSSTFTSPVSQLPLHATPLPSQDPSPLAAKQPYSPPLSSSSPSLSRDTRDRLPSREGVSRSDWGTSTTPMSSPSHRSRVAPPPPLMSNTPCWSPISCTSASVSLVLLPSAPTPVTVTSPSPLFSYASTPLFSSGKSLAPPRRGTTSRLSLSSMREGTIMRGDRSQSAPFAFMHHSSGLERARGGRRRHSEGVSTPPQRWRMTENKNEIAVAHHEKESPGPASARGGAHRNTIHTTPSSSSFFSSSLAAVSSSWKEPFSKSQRELEGMWLSGHPSEMEGGGSTPTAVPLASPFSSSLGSTGSSGDPVGKEIHSAETKPSPRWSAPLATERGGGESRNPCPLSPLANSIKRSFSMHGQGVEEGSFGIAAPSHLSAVEGHPFYTPIRVDGAGEAPTISFAGTLSTTRSSSPLLGRGLPSAGEGLAFSLRGPVVHEVGVPTPLKRKSTRVGPPPPMPSAPARRAARSPAQDFHATRFASSSSSSAPSSPSPSASVSSVVVEVKSYFEDQFEPLRLLGKGAQGAVLLCRERLSNRLCAVKILLVDNYEREKDTLQEIQAQSLVQRCKHLVQYHSSWSEVITLKRGMELASIGLFPHHVSDHQASSHTTPPHLPRHRPHRRPFSSPFSRPSSSSSFLSSKRQDLHGNSSPYPSPDVRSPCALFPCSSASFSSVALPLLRYTDSTVPVRLPSLERNRIEAVEKKESVLQKKEEEVPTVLPVAFCAPSSFHQGRPPNMSHSTSPVKAVRMEEQRGTSRLSPFSFSNTKRTPKKQRENPHPASAPPKGITVPHMRRTRNNKHTVTRAGTPSSMLHQTPSSMPSGEAHPAPFSQSHHLLPFSSSSSTSSSFVSSDSSIHSTVTKRMEKDAPPCGSPRQTDHPLSTAPSFGVSTPLPTPSSRDVKRRREKNTSERDAEGKRNATSPFSLRAPPPSPYVQRVRQEASTTRGTTENGPSDSCHPASLPLREAKEKAPSRPVSSSSHHPRKANSTRKKDQGGRKMRWEVEKTKNGHRRRKRSYPSEASLATSESAFSCPATPSVVRPSWKYLLNNTEEEQGLDSNGFLGQLTGIPSSYSSSGSPSRTTMFTDTSSSSTSSSWSTSGSSVNAASLRDWWSTEEKNSVNRFESPKKRHSLTEKEDGMAHLKRGRSSRRAKEGKKQQKKKKKEHVSSSKRRRKRDEDSEEGDEDDRWLSTETSKETSEEESSGSFFTRAVYQLINKRVAFIQMELCPCTLNHLLAQRQKIDRIENLVILLQLCMGLLSMHDHGLIHRDVKPANIFLDFSRRSLAEIASFASDDDEDEDKDEDDDSEEESMEEGMENTASGKPLVDSLSSPHHPAPSLSASLCGRGGTEMETTSFTPLPFSFHGSPSLSSMRIRARRGTAALTFLTEEKVENRDGGGRRWLPSSFYGVGDGIALEASPLARPPHSVVLPSPSHPRLSQSLIPAPSCALYSMERMEHGGVGIEGDVWNTSSLPSPPPLPSSPFRSVSATPAAVREREMVNQLLREMRAIPPEDARAFLRRHSRKLLEKWIRFGRLCGRVLVFPETPVTTVPREVEVQVEEEKEEEGSEMEKGELHASRTPPPSSPVPLCPSSSVDMSSTSSRRDSVPATTAKTPTSPTTTLPLPSTTHSTTSMSVTNTAVDPVSAVASSSPMAQTVSSVPAMSSVFIHMVPGDDRTRQRERRLQSRVRRRQEKLYRRGQRVLCRTLLENFILVRLGDFGLAKFESQQHPHYLQGERILSIKNANTLGVGSPLYASPEQLRGDICTCASDAFSLAIVMAELYLQPTTMAERLDVLQKTRQGRYPTRDVLEQYPELAVIRSLTQEQPFARMTIRDLKSFLIRILRGCLDEELSLLAKEIGGNLEF